MRGLSKYIGLILILLLMFAHLLKAQEDNSNFDYQLFGLKAGWNMSSISLQPAISDMMSDYGYQAGLVYVFSNKKNVGIQLELNYSSRRWIEYFTEYQAKTELQYIEIPLITNINLGKARLKYLINLGTYFAVNVDKKQTTNLPQNTSNYESFVNRNENGSDFGLIIGGGVRYFTKLGVFQLDARYMYGYQKLYNEEATGFQYSNMSTLSLGMIYMINLKKNAK